MSGEQDRLDVAQKLGPAASAVVSTFVAIIALVVAVKAPGNHVTNRQNR